MSAAERAPVLATDELRYRYGRRGGDVLSGLTMAVSGQVIAILGPNGAGKSTLLSLVTGARRPSGGGLRVVGLEMNQHSQRRQLQWQLGFVPQAMGLFPGYTVEQFLRYVCWLRRVPADEQERAIDESLIATDLARLRGQKIRTLSGGTQQRAKLAQALLNSPRVVVLDEPTVLIDPDQRADFLDLVATLKRRAPILLATHLIEDVARVCDSVLVLSGGTVAFSGSTRELAGTAAGEAVAGPDVERGYRRIVRARRPVR